MELGMSRTFTDANDKEAPALDQEKVKRFFSERALKVGDVSYKQAVIYQDKDFQLAEDRDAAEKSLLLPKLELSPADRFLDIGCGTGRWAEVAAPSVQHYHGTDFSAEMVKIAKERDSLSHTKYTCLPCTDITLEKLDEILPFNKIICFGVLIYINDFDISKVLRAVATVSTKECTFMLREPVGLKKRLTINDHFSDDMEQFYSAIYRTEDELMALCNDVLIGSGFRLNESADVFQNDALNNRSETRQKYFLFSRS